MIIPENLMRAISEAATEMTVFCVYCDSEIREEIASFLKAEFELEWNKALDEAGKVYGECDQKINGYNPLRTLRKTENGVEMCFGNLAVYYGDELRAVRPNGEDALDNMIQKFKQSYPGTAYDGFIGYTWADESSGESIQRELTSDPNEDLSEKTYKSVANAIQDTVKYESSFLQQEMEDVIRYYDVEEIEDMLNFLRKYSQILPDETKKSLSKIVKKCGYKKKLF